MTNNSFKVRHVTLIAVLILLCQLCINTGQCRPSSSSSPSASISQTTTTPSTTTRHHKHHNKHTTTTENPDVLDVETINQLRPCYEIEDTMELCQRCAKEAKAKNVFPLCCSNVDGVKNWCEEYIYYGLD